MVPNSIPKMPERVNVNGTLFLHVGKAGGGTIMEHVRDLGFQMLKAHPHPIPHNPEIHTYLMNLRDPVDRFVSNFYWVGLISCYPLSNNETRIFETELRKPMLEPHLYCRNSKQDRHANNTMVMVHDLYKGDAEKLMNDMCNFDDKGAREQALESIRLLLHSKYSISYWLTSLGDGITKDPMQRNSNSNTSADDSSRNGTSKAATLVGIILEAGFNFKKQIEDALVFALDQNQKEGSVAIESAAVSHTERNASAIIRGAAIALERKEQRQTEKKRSVLHTHSSHVSKRVAFPPFLERMQAHQKQNISDEAACCLASTIYREDYTKWLVLVTVEEGNNTGPTTWTTPLGELVCHGPSAGTCKEALVAISQRHSRRRCDNDVVPKQQQVLYDNKNSNSNNDNDIDVEAVTVVKKAVMFYAEEESYTTNNSSNTIVLNWMIWICWFTAIAFGLLVYRNRQRRRR